MASGAAGDALREGKRGFDRPAVMEGAENGGGRRQSSDERRTVRSYRYASAGAYLRTEIPRTVCRRLLRSPPRKRHAGTVFRAEPGIPRRRMEHPGKAGVGILSGGRVDSSPRLQFRRG